LLVINPPKSTRGPRCTFRFVLLFSNLECCGSFYLRVNFGGCFICALDCADFPFHFYIHKRLDCIVYGLSLCLLKKWVCLCVPRKKEFWSRLHVKSRVGYGVPCLENFGPDFICKAEWNMMFPSLQSLYKFWLFLPCFLECAVLEIDSLLRYPTLFTKEKVSLQLLRSIIDMILGFILLFSNSECCWSFYLRVSFSGCFICALDCADFPRLACSCPL
jgi:hypothetical protein